MMNAHLHGGKWSHEEELYATSLMDAFKAGVLPPDDIEEGTSLRKYLAKKLMCSPKRVSKKYEGTNYNGKQVYFKSRGESAMSPAERLVLLSKIQRLEHNFLKGLSEGKVNEGQVSRSPSQDFDAYNSQLQLHQAISGGTNQSRSFQPQAPAGLGWPQSLGLSGHGHSAHANIRSSLLSDLRTGARNLLGSPMLTATQTPQDQELARMAARLSAGSRPSSSPRNGGTSARDLAILSSNPSLFSLADSDLRASAAHLRQLEQTSFLNDQYRSIGSSSSWGYSGANSLGGVAEVRRLLELQQQQSSVERSVFNSFSDDATVSLLRSPAVVRSPTSDLIDNSTNTQNVQMKPQLPLERQSQQQDKWASNFLSAKRNLLALQNAAERPGDEGAKPTAKRSKQG